MKPRLVSSKKWTALPPELCAQMEFAVRDSYGPFISDYEVEVEGRIYPEELLLRVSFPKPGSRDQDLRGWQGSLRQPNFLASVLYTADKEKALDKIFSALDVLGTMIEDYFRATDPEEQGRDYPREWQGVTGGKFTKTAPSTATGPVTNELSVMFSTVNQRLEDEANRLLGEWADEGLVVVEDEPNPSTDQITVH